MHVLWTFGSRVGKVVRGWPPERATGLCVKRTGVTTQLVAYLMVAQG